MKAPLGESFVSGLASAFCVLFAAVDSCASLSLDTWGVVSGEETYAFFASSPLHLVSLIAVQKRGMPRNKPFFAANDVCLG